MLSLTDYIISDGRVNLDLKRTFEGSDHDLTEILSQHLSKGTNYENSWSGLKVSWPIF
jgi:hypothetical protein